MRTFPVFSRKACIFRRTTRAKELTGACKSHVHSIVGMLVPVMDEQPVGVVPVEPSGGDQGIDEGIFVPPIVDPQSNVFVREFADIAPRSFPGCEVPERLHQAHCLPESDIQPPAETLHLRVPHRLTLHSLT